MNVVKTGQLISNKRKELGLTQRDLAEELRISEQAVSKWERGRSFPDISILVPLSKVLNLSVYDLLEGGIVMDKVESKSSDSNISKSTIKPIHQAELELDGTIEYYGNKMNQYRNMLYKSGYYIIVSALAIAVNRAMHMSGVLGGESLVPSAIIMDIGLAIAVIALILAIVEIKLNVTFFYAYDTHWKGNALINSSFLFGVSMWFFLEYSVAAAVIVFLVELILINIITYFVKPSKKKSDESDE